MPRRSTGGVVVDTRRQSAVFALRFRAYGRRQYVTLGTADDGWTEAKAEVALRHVLADVERGLWQPPERQAVPAAAPALPEDPTFHEFASQWYRASEGGWRENTRVDYQWQLTSHLLPFFAKHRLSQITIQEVDRYRTAKVREAAKITETPVERRRVVTGVDGRGRPCRHRERPLSATSINKTITRLAQILEVAVEYELIDRNPAKGKRRRVKASKPAAVWLQDAEQISALLDAAGELDRAARLDRRHIPRRAILATLVLAGLRISEMLGLRWRDVDLTAGRIRVGESKTDAGVRQIDMLPALRDELLALKAAARRAGPNDLLFGTSQGHRQHASNVRNRVLAPAVKRANERLAEAGEVPLPEPLTPHKLRHSFASLLVAIGEDPASVMSQLGHTDPSFTLRVYTHGMRRDATSRQALRRLVGVEDAVIGQRTGSNGDSGGVGGDLAPLLTAENPPISSGF
jgi:integrase